MVQAFSNPNKGTNMFQSRAAVVGTGFIGPVHIEGLLRAGVRVQGVLGTSPEKSQSIASRFGLPRAYTHYHELLEDPAVDVVHITSPNRFHFQQTVEALQAGKHVLCEKPLAMDSRESALLVEHAQKSGLKTGVNYNVRFYPLCIEAAEQVRRGELGDLFHVTGSYVQDWLHQPTDFNWRVLQSEGGALRAIADIGTHWLDLIQSISGQSVVAVCADLQTVFPTRTRPAGGTETFTSKLAAPKRDGIDVAIDTEDYGALLFRLESGARGSMHVSQVTAGHKNCIRFEMAGSKKSIAWNSQTPNELWVGHRSNPNSILPRDPSLLSDRAAQHAQYPGGHNEGFPDTFKQLFRSFYASIETPESPMHPTPSFEDGHREILLCEAIHQSAQEQRWIEVGSKCQ
ncbi:1,5-anhydro-D-fructose reductase [Pirellula sp. SH-Sr6A]|nr:1,5-anhydro-D-fructose reductase [Pirellula sp. SH-Sr6A]